MAKTDDYGEQCEITVGGFIMNEKRRLVIEKLLEAGATVKAFDPVAMAECKRRIGDTVTYCKDMYEAVIDADAVALLTEWKQFRMPSWAIIHKAMNNYIVVDGRNIYDSEELQELGFIYSRIGQK